MTPDLVFEGFLRRQLDEGLALAAASDLLELAPLPRGLFGDGALEPAAAPDRFLASFHCLGLVRSPGGKILEAERFALGVHFPPDYLRSADAFRVLAWLDPRNVWHPNISDRLPLICIGHLAPATSLVEILERCFDVITYNAVTMDERNALNHAACAWARRNTERFPVDPRPLRRRRLEFDVVVESR
jgi:hypothetical protein